MAKVMVAVPSLGNVHVRVHVALHTMECDTRHTVVEQHVVQRPIEHNRNMIARKFLESDCEWLVTMDSDNPPVRNPLDLIEAVKVKADIVACPTPLFTSGQYEAAQGLPVLHWGVYSVKDNGETLAIYSGPKHGLQPCDAASTGCVLIRRHVLEAIDEPFTCPRTKGLVTMGTDIAFFGRVRHAGFKAYAHWDYVCHHFREVDLLDVMKLAKAVPEGALDEVSQ